ncbi:hypothetical protein TH30_03365 [Thalassospira profundimaris]|uniref:Uncharacterized protein n=1 Tax=Thalassospira profundimaris TaxID=502049 RepID=A0A367X6S4_9PROT|nr:hypothetical protein TH30_03365 [Thalassospira profundimaris]
MIDLTAATGPEQFRKTNSRKQDQYMAPDPERSIRGKTDMKFPRIIRTFGALEPVGQFHQSGLEPGF